MGNPVVHFEISVRDAQKGLNFYTELFDWNIKTDEQMDYHEVVKAEGEPGIGGGIFQAKEGEFPPYVTVYVDVDELQKYLDKANELGGKQLLGPTPIPGVGAVAMFADPDGNPVGLFTTKQD